MPLFGEFAGQELTPYVAQVGVARKLSQRAFFDHANRALADAQQQADFPLGQSARVRFGDLTRPPRGMDQRQQRAGGLPVSRPASGAYRLP